MLPDIIRLNASALYANKYSIASRKRNNQHNPRTCIDFLILPPYA